MSNYEQFLEILEAGNPSTNFGWLDKDYIKVTCADDNISALVIAEAGLPDVDWSPTVTWYNNLEICAPIFQKWCEDAGAHFYAAEKESFFMRDALDEAFNASKKFVIVECLS